MADRVLRDHTETCGHGGAFDGNDWTGGGPQQLWLCDRQRCPGGRVVILTEEEQETEYINQYLDGAEWGRRFVSEWEPV